MAHDLARMCHSGKTAYLQLPKTKLNHWEKRDFLAKRFWGDRRMGELHKRKLEVPGQKWDEVMKASLRELASDALKAIKATAQEEAASPKSSPPMDGQNNNGDSLGLSGSSDEGLASDRKFDVDGGLDPGRSDAPANWPNAKESLRSISPRLEEQMEGLRADKAHLEAENRDLKAENRDLKAANQRHVLNHSEGNGPVLPCTEFQPSGGDQAATNFMSSPGSPNFQYDVAIFLEESEHQPSLSA